VWFCIKRGGLSGTSTDRWQNKMNNTLARVIYLDIVRQEYDLAVDGKSIDFLPTSVFE
jgi:hypothetical protein